MVWNIVPGLVWLGFPTNVIFTVDWDTPLYLIHDDLVWSGLVQQVALRVFIIIDADADPTAMVKMQPSATICSVGMIQTSMFNLVSTMVSFM